MYICIDEKRIKNEKINFLTESAQNFVIGAV